jgi:hypothetical protein
MGLELDCRKRPDCRPSPRDIRRSHSARPREMLRAYAARDSSLHRPSLRCRTQMRESLRLGRDFSRLKRRISLLEETFETVAFRAGRA